LVVAKSKERLAVSKLMVKKIDMERYNPKNFNEEEAKKQYKVTIKNKFAALKNLDDNGDINRAWNTIKEDIKILTKEIIGLCESKHLKPWFYEDCLKLADRRKQGKLHGLQDTSEVSEDNLSNVGREASKHFRDKKREYLKDKINELGSDSKN
jgi:hypothetical protein